MTHFVPPSATVCNMVFFLQLLLVFFLQLLLAFFLQFLLLLFICISQHPTDPRYPFDAFPLGMPNAVGDKTILFQLGNPGFRFRATDALEHWLSAAAEALEVFHQSWILLGLACDCALVACRWSSLQTTLIKLCFVELS